MEPRTIFYFQYQMKVEFIPCICDEVLLFLSHFQRCLPNTQLARKMLGLLLKKMRALDQMYYRYWNDFRIGLLLPAKEALLHFYETHRQHFATIMPVKEQSSHPKGVESNSKKEKKNVKAASPLKTTVKTEQNAKNPKSKEVNPAVRFAHPLQIRTAESNYHSSQTLSLSYVNDQPSLLLSPPPHKKVIREPLHREPLSREPLKKMSREEFISYLRKKQQ